MYHHDIRPVYKHRNIVPTFDNALYFYAKFTANCPICISYHENPCVIPCGHTFCRECLDNLGKYTRNCPVCNAFYWSFRPVQFYIAQQLTDTLMFVRLNTSVILKDKVCTFFEDPYRYSYFEAAAETSSGISLEYNSKAASGQNKSGITPGHTFYQSIDGQLYFLNPTCTKHLKVLPQHIYGRVRSKCTCKSFECPYIELRHIPASFEISIITIDI